MKKKDTGWILIHRKIQESQGYFAETFCRNMAWIDLLLLANHTDSFFYVRGVRVDVKRGQCGYSEDSLAKRWKWSRGKVRRFLKELQTAQQIEQQKSHVTTLISILNYDQYQADSTTGKTTKGTADGQQPEQQTDTNKELLKNDKAYIAHIRKFYEAEVEANKTHEKIGLYKAMLSYLFGKNETGEPFINVLRMDKQISFKSFLSMEEASLETGESAKDILNEMENYKMLRKNNSSIPATAMNWMHRNFKRNNKAA